MTTNEDQPGEVHRAAHLPPIHLHTLLPSIKIFKTRFHLHQEETNESGVNDNNDDNCNNNVNDNNDDIDNKTLRSPMRVETK